MTYLDRHRAVVERVRHIHRPLVVEVGVDDGELSALLLERGAACGLRLLMVDWWRVPEPGSAYALTGDFAGRTAEQWRAARLHALSLAARWPGRCTILEGPSVEMASQITAASVDLVFIDAAHDEASVRADITAWLPTVKSGGWIGGHDYLNEPARPYGVRAAVDAIFGDRIILDVDDTWWTRVVY